MVHKISGSLEVQPKPDRRRFKAAYKRQIVAEAATCQYGALGSLHRRWADDDSHLTALTLDAARSGKTSASCCILCIDRPRIAMSTLR